MMSGMAEDSSDGWKYVIVASKFTHHLLEAAISKSFGVLIPEMVHLFNTDLSLLGLICTFPVTWMLMSCPIVAYMLRYERLSKRGVAILGGILASSCLIAAAFTRSAVVFGIMLALCGFGMATSFMPALVTMNEYFPRGFILMDNVAQLGGIFGILVFPPLLERCNRAYGYSGAMILLGGATLNSVAAGFAIIPPRFGKKDSGPKGTMEMNQVFEEYSNIEESSGNLENFKKSPICENNSRPEHQNKSVRAEVHTSSEHESDEGFGSLKRESPYDGDSETTDGYPNCNLQKLRLKQMMHKDVFKNNPAILHKRQTNIKGYESVEYFRIDELGSDETTAGDLENDEPKESRDTLKRLCDAIIRWFLSCIFIEEPLFTLQLPVQFLIQYATYSWIIFLVPRAEWLGIESYHAVLLSSIGGAGALTGRSVLLAMLYYGANPFHVCCAASSVVVATCMVDPLIRTFPVMCCMAFLQGWALFTTTALGSAFCKMTCSEKNFGVGNAYAALVVGIGGNVGGAISGLIFDLTGSYTTVFISIGAAHCVIIGIVVIFLLIVHQRERRKDEESQ